MKSSINSTELFTCKKGYLRAESLEIPFDFGLIFESEGILTLEISINEDFDLLSLVKDDDDKYFNLNYTAICKSDRNDELEMRSLYFTNIETGVYKASLICYDSLIHTKKKEGPFEKGIKPNKNSFLHYLEIEGLKMQFIDITEEVRARRGVKVQHPIKIKRDHTTVSLVYKSMMYNQVYYKSETNDNIIVEFIDKDSANNLTIATYLEFKLNYLYALSLLNGAEVRIRKEFTGDFYSVGKIDSHKIIYYSYKTVFNERYNTFIPLNDPFERKSHILSKFFLFNFDKYLEWNDKIDLNSIIFYFINSVQAKSMAEAVFIQMIAFERITTLYAEYCGETEIFLPSKEDFLEIKKDFIKVLESHKDKFGASYNDAKSKLNNLNQVKRLSTTEKMFRIINDVEIPITKEIEFLVERVRHKTIHRGELESGDNGLVNFYLLDELLQEIILRLVGYNGPRESKILLSQ